MTKKIAVFRIIWKIPQKSRLESRINSTKNEGEGRNEFPEVKGIDTSVYTTSSIPLSACRNEFPEVKGIDTYGAHLQLPYKSLVEMSPPT